jgi:glycosyltransferase involved in cell wall biosynthesis
MISVVHVITRLTVGGSSENTVSIIEELERFGYASTLVLGPQSEGPTVEDARRRGCRVVELDGLVREVSPARDVAAVLQLYRLFRRLRPAIVHTHTSKAGFVGRFAAWLAGVPAVIHQPHGHIFYGYWSRPRTAMFVALERLAAHWTDTMIALTPREIEEHVERRIGQARQYAVVPSGVPTRALREGAATRPEARARLGLPANAYVVAGVGRLVPIKGFDLLVGALAELVAQVPDAHVVLIGDGVERGALQAQAAALGVSDRLHITGAVGDVTRLLPGADVLAAPSRNEGMGRVLVEAMALGLPVVGTRVGGIGDVILDGECGLVVPPDDPAALAAALVELGLDAARRAKLGEGARPRAEAFSIGVAAAAMRDVYDGLVRSRRLPR